MIVQTIHEILNPFDVHEKKHGYGVALFMIAGSIHSNPQFIVRFYDTGILRTCDQNDLVVYGNPTAGEKLTPESIQVTKKDVDQLAYQKAVSLVIDFSEIYDNDGIKIPVSHKLAKKCAGIAIDEMLAQDENTSSNHYKEFLSNVKIQLEKL
jgi:hypothetical protein